MSEASDRRQREKTQARVGLASNVVGLTAGLAATGAALRNPAIKDPMGSSHGANAGPVTGRLARRLSNPKVKSRLIRAGALGALGLQVTNTAGDVVANRVLSREAKFKKEQTVSKSIEQSFMSVGVSGPVTGVGVNIEKGLVPAYLTRESASDREAARPHKIRFDKKKMKAAYDASQVKKQAYGGVSRYARAQALTRALELKNGRLQVAQRTKEGVRESRRMESRASAVGKRYFDAEADRQRRLGAASGILGGTAIVAGGAALKDVKHKVGAGTVDGKPGYGAQVGVQGSKKLLRRKAGLAALAAVSGTGAVASYKRGISRRNQTWQ